MWASCRIQSSRTVYTRGREQDTPSGKHQRIAGIGGGGVAVVWREDAGWQMEGIVNFGPNVAIFLLKSGS